jgi:hypothetical protein
MADPSKMVVSLFRRYLVSTYSVPMQNNTDKAMTYNELMPNTKKDIANAGIKEIITPNISF